MAKARLEQDSRTIYPLEFRKRFQTVNLLEGCCLVCPPTWVVYNLRYNYHRMYYILGGEAYYECAGTKLRLEAGKLYVFPSQSIRYQIRHNPKNPLRVMWCHFEMVPDITNDLIVVDVIADSAFQRLIDLWQEIARQPEPGNEMYHVLMVILYAMERMELFEYLNPYFTDVQQYIMDHITEEKLSVAVLAETFGYERSYFTRKFREVFYLAPSEYIRSIRMNRAASLLDRGVKVDQICASIGYADKKAFSRAFHRYFKISPSQYIESHKLQPQ